MRQAARLQGRVRGGPALTDREFEQQLSDQFEGDFKFSFHLAPPILGGAKDALGRPKKRAEPLDVPAFCVLAKLRFLRGTALDIFASNPDRKLERDLIAGYEKATALSLLSPINVDVRWSLLSLRDRIRGLGRSRRRRSRTPKRVTSNSPPISPTRCPRRGRSLRNRCTRHRPTSV